MCRGMKVMILTNINKKNISNNDIGRCNYVWGNCDFSKDKYKNNLMFHFEKLSHEHCSL